MIFPFLASGAAALGHRPMIATACAAAGAIVALRAAYDCGTALAAVHRVAIELGWSGPKPAPQRRHLIDQSHDENEPEELELIRGAS